MKRDRTPVLAAGVTAVVSSGLLVLAVARGWLGPDVGRGAAFCEAPRGGAVRQPANTFSNAGFVVAGLLIAWHAARHDRRTLGTVLGCIVVLLGPASAAMHATQSELGGHLDMLSMYLIASFAAAYAVMRWRRAGVRLLAAVFTAGLVVCEVAGLWREPIPVVTYAGNAAFGALLVGATVIESVVMRRPEVRIRRVYGYIALGSMLIAFTVWNATKTWLCDPHSLVQGHAVWHLLCAVSAYFLYRYYASESTHSSGER